DLPVPVRAGEPEASTPHRYVVVYTTTAAPGWLWTRVEAPAPSPPASPAAFRRRWRLAPELSPLGGPSLRRQPGPGEGAPSAPPPVGPDDLFRAAATPAWPWPFEWDETRRPEALPDVLLGLRAKTEQTRPIGPVLADAAAALRQKRRQFLVVDAAALAEAGVGPARGAARAGPSAAGDAPPWHPR